MPEKKIKNIVALNGVTLESTEAATQAATSRSIIDSYYSDQLNLTLTYTTGAAEVGTNCYVKVWGYVGTKAENPAFPYSNSEDVDIKADSTKWIQIGEYTISGGTATFVPTLFKVAGGAGATTYSSHFALGVTFSKIRVSAYETGVNANKGTLTAIVSVQ